MSNGEIAPCVVKEFETLCENFFLHTGKTILEAERVPALFASFESPIVLDWLTSELRDWFHCLLRLHDRVSK